MEASPADRRGVVQSVRNFWVRTILSKSSPEGTADTQSCPNERANLVSAVPSGLIAVP
jgi:hypothetical protein